jgi:hypothetical protein
MAVTAVLGAPAGAINYTFTTDTSADWPSVANSTYFYDKADKLVHFKNASGTVLEIFAAGGSAAGIFGISNTSGVYTYYTTLTLAMTAATSGQVIEMFANYTETGAVSITLKDGVNINGNGYTYTLNNSGLLNAFVTPTTTGIRISILNLYGVRSGSTGQVSDNAFIASVSGNGILDCSGSTFKNSSTFGCAITTTSGLEFINATCIADTAYGSFGCYGTGSLGTNITAYSTSGYAIRVHAAGIINNSYGYSDSGIGVYGGYYATISNCTGVSNTGDGINSYGNTTNSTGRSNTGTGFTQQGYGRGTNCSGISVSGAGIQNYSAMSNCVGISSSSYGIRMGYGITYNSTAQTTSGIAMWNTNGNPQLYNVIAINEWNNAAGYGMRGNGGFFPNTILNCTFILANATAPYFFNDAVAQAIRLRGNTYLGGGAYNANLTQAITAVEDSQGNIFL